MHGETTAQWWLVLILHLLVGVATGVLFITGAANIAAKAAADGPTVGAEHVAVP